MTAKLYRHELSGHAHRVELFLSLLGKEYDLINVDLAAGEHQSATAASWQAAHRPQVLRAMRQQHVASADCTATTAADR